MLWYEIFYVPKNTCKFKLFQIKPIFFNQFQLRLNEAIIFKNVRIMHLMGHVGRQIPSSCSVLPILIPDHSTVLTSQPKRFSQFPHVPRLRMVVQESSFLMCLLIHLARPMPHWLSQALSSFSSSPWRAQSHLLSCQGLRQGQQLDWMICRP